MPTQLAESRPKAAGFNLCPNNKRKAQTQTRKHVAHSGYLIIKSMSHLNSSSVVIIRYHVTYFAHCLRRQEKILTMHLKPLLLVVMWLMAILNFCDIISDQMVMCHFATRKSTVSSCATFERTHESPAGYSLSLTSPVHHYNDLTSGHPSNY